MRSILAAALVLAFSAARVQAVCFNSSDCPSGSLCFAGVCSGCTENALCTGVTAGCCLGFTCRGGLCTRNATATAAGPQPGATLSPEAVNAVVNVALIVGLVVSGLFACIVAALVYCCCCRKQKSDSQPQVQTIYVQQQNPYADPSQYNTYAPAPAGYAAPYGAPPASDPQGYQPSYASPAGAPPPPQSGNQPNYPPPKWGN
ncbi:hypothetical protein BDR26DRAFT_915282 [Obelidium mucronatum]|nr:hypothetical protein BDR26DRAFT_915282 [Obelidium mucronatum]